MRRYGLRADQWERIKDLLPGRADHVGGTAKDSRLFVEAVLYRYRAVFAGAIFRRGSATGRTPTDGFADGVKAEFSSVSSKPWWKTVTPNT